MSDHQLSRRAFLSTSGAFMIGWASPEAWAQAARPSPKSPNNPDLLADSLDAYLAIDKN